MLYRDYTGNLRFDSLPVAGVKIFKITTEGPQHVEVRPMVDTQLTLGISPGDGLGIVTVN